MTKIDALGAYYSNILRKIKASSFSSTPYSAK